MTQIQMDEIVRLLVAHQDACMRMIGDTPYWTVLATATSANVARWMHDLHPWPRTLDARGETWRCQVFAEPVDPQAAMKRAVEAAVKHDVTLQLLCCYEPIAESEEQFDLGGGARVTVSDVREEYPVLHLARSRKGWKV